MGFVWNDLKCVDSSIGALSTFYHGKGDGAVGVWYAVLPAFVDGRLAAGGPQLLFIVCRCCRTMLAAVGCMVWAAEEICHTAVPPVIPGATLGLKVIMMPYSS